MLYSRVFKRIIDLVASTILFILLSPIVILVMLLLSWANKGKPFFVQTRPGKDERLFQIIKFKTMNDSTDEQGKLLPDSQRLTTIGKVIRKTSLDELPQLINVIKGDMSFIGPRPLLTEYLPHYTDRERLRHAVRPGITGLAQISGRNMLWWDDRLNKDVEYVEQISFSLDIRILLKTIANVLSSKDIEVDPHSKMPNLVEYRTDPRWHSSTNMKVGD